MSEDYVRYIDRTREYYLAEGYKTPYKWAHFEDIPFARLEKPLDKCRIGLVTTSDIAVRTESGERESHDAAALVGNVYSIAIDIPVERLYSRALRSPHDDARRRQCLLSGDAYARTRRRRTNRRRRAALPWRLHLVQPARHDRARRI